MSERLKRAVYAEAYGAAPNKGPEQGLRNAARFLYRYFGVGGTTAGMLMAFRLRRKQKEVKHEQA